MTLFLAKAASPCKSSAPHFRRGSSASGWWIVAAAFVVVAFFIFGGKSDFLGATISFDTRNAFGQTFAVTQYNKDGWCGQQNAIFEENLIRMETGGGGGGSCSSPTVFSKLKLGSAVESVLVTFQGSVNGYDSGSANIQIGNFHLSASGSTMPQGSNQQSASGSLTFQKDGKVYLNGVLVRQDEPLGEDFDVVLSSGWGGSPQSSAGGSLLITQFNIVRVATPPVMSPPTNPSCSTHQYCWGLYQSCSVGCQSGICADSPTPQITLCDDGATPIGSYPVCDVSQCPVIILNVCPTACVPLWTLSSGSCSLNECGSGCGADNMTTFKTQAECQSKKLAVEDNTTLTFVSGDGKIPIFPLSGATSNVMLIVFAVIALVVFLTLRR